MSSPRYQSDDLSRLDPANKAKEHLDDVLKEETSEGEESLIVLDEKLLLKKKENIPNEKILPQPPKIETADEVRTGAPVVITQSERNSVRLLIITRNVSTRVLGSRSQKRLVELSKIFSEIHVVILNEFTEATVSTVRLTDNVWLYSTDSSSWWRMGIDAYRIANEQLIFAGAFRADLIIGEDPFEAGVVGYAIAKKYNRSFQIHVLEDIYSPQFQDQDSHNVWRALLSPFVLKRADCIRTSSEIIREEIIHAHPHVASITEVLPIYYDLSAWRNTSPAFSLKERYPQFNFIMLHISHMNAASHTNEVIHGVAPLLRTYPTLGLVVVGNGLYRPALEKQVIALGIQRQVEFEPVPNEVISHMKTADILIHLSDDRAEDINVLQAAAVKLPILATSTSIAGNLFKDNQSACLCPIADPACVSQRLRTFLSDNLSRVHLAAEAETAIFERIEQDYNAYLLSYRDSIQRCMGSTTQVA